MKSNAIPDDFQKEFARRFRSKLDNWKRKNPKKGKDGKSRNATNLDFASSVAAVCGTDRFDEKTVRNWIKGIKKPSPKHFDAICKVLQCERWELLPHDKAHYYEFDKTTQEGIVEQQAIYADSIGLKKSFLLWLRSLSTYKADFPIYKPPLPNAQKILDERAPAYIEQNLAPAYDLRSPFQMKNGDSIVTLSAIDLDFIKEMQDEVERLVLEMMLRKKEQYQDELQQLNKGRIEMDSQGHKWTAY